MIISGAEVGRRMIDHEEAKRWWDDNRWDLVGQHILIRPFVRDRLGVLGYEFTVGAQYCSLRSPYEDARSLTEGQLFEVGPGETVLVLTEEFVGLPKSVMGLIVPRARRIFEGALINATRIDPTWYGKLIVGFTNLAKYPTVLRRGDPFCVCLFFDAQEVETTLQDERTEHLGRERLVVSFPSLRPREPRRPETVTPEDLQRVVEQHGPPFDIVIGGFHQTRVELFTQVEREVAPNIVRLAVSEAKGSAFNWMLGLITAFIVAVIGAMLGALGKYLNLY